MPISSPGGVTYVSFGEKYTKHEALKIAGLSLLPFGINSGNKTLMVTVPLMSVRLNFLPPQCLLGCFIEVADLQQQEIPLWLARLQALGLMVPGDVSGGMGW